MGARGKSLPLAEKIEIISRWTGGIKNKAQIARDVKTSESTVHKWILRWETTGSLACKRAQGRKRVLDERACKRAFYLLIIPFHYSHT